MANIPIKKPKEFIPELRKLETTDRNHADVFNAQYEVLINNDAYLKEHTDLSDEHMENSEIHVTQQDKDVWNSKASTDAATQSKAGLESPDDKKKLDGIATGAEVNQHAFSYISAGGVTITASNKTETFSMAGGENITISGDNASKKITISANRDGGNADTLDGYHASSFSQAGHTHDDKLSRTVITTITDFDLFNKTGIYHIQYTEGDNQPVAYHGTLYCDFDVGTPYQIFVPDAIAEYDFKRRYYNSAWSAWQKRLYKDNYDDAITLQGHDVSYFNKNISQHPPFFINGSNYSSYASAIIAMKNEGYQAGTIYASSYQPSDMPTGVTASWSTVTWRSSCTNSIFSIELYIDRNPVVYKGSLVSGENNSAITWTRINDGGNADTLDGYHASSFSQTGHTHDGEYLPYLAGLSDGYVGTGRKSGTTKGEGSTAEGNNTTASASYSHAEGYGTTASASYSHAEGYCTTASASYSHAEGYSTTASGSISHAEGYSTTASGSYSHAEGKNTKTLKTCAHAEGYNTSAAGMYSHAGGRGTTANTYQTVIGTNNVEVGLDNSFSFANDSYFIVGGGDPNGDKKNVFRVQSNGSIYSTGAYNTSGADYAEYFEWFDKNIQNEDRVGYFVTMMDDKIKIADTDDYILGVVSSTASVIGNSQDDQWNEMELRDEWGRVIVEEVKVPEEVEEIEKEDGTKEKIVVSPAHVEIKPKINPKYDSTQKYVPRSKRLEWSPVGMLGVLRVRDDGTCQINGFCKVNRGIATAADSGWRVIGRISGNIIKIVFK